MYKRILTAGLLFGMAATAPPAHAMGCAERSKVVEQLQDVYSEQLTGRGLQTAQSMIEVWASPDSGSFTVLVTDAQGISCVVATGTNWFLEKDQIEPAGILG